LQGASHSKKIQRNLRHALNSWILRCAQYDKIYRYDRIWSVLKNEAYLNFSGLPRKAVSYVCAFWQAFALNFKGFLRSFLLAMMKGWGLRAIFSKSNRARLNACFVV